jgi:hypothetical protein
MHITDRPFLFDEIDRDISSDVRICRHPAGEEQAQNPIDLRNKDKNATRRESMVHEVNINPLFKVVN